jgi:hypothetical protein
MRMRITGLILPLLLTVGCDDGPIRDDGGSLGPASGTTVNLTCTIEGCGEYAADNRYSVAIAAFREGDNFAVVSKPLSEGENVISLANIPADAAMAEVCIINRLRERVFTFASLPLNGEEVVDFDPGTLSTGMFRAIDSKIFATSCTQCHGATGHSAAGLNLTSAEAYGMLVGVPSTVIEGEERVKPGDASASTLWQAVATDISDGWAFAHRNLLTDTHIDFIEHWINSGAQ